MRLQLFLPKVNPKALAAPATCADADCQSKLVRLHQPVSKALRDTVHQQVEAYRYRCLSCQRTFRVYPPGVSAAQTSDRVKGLAVLLYLLGLSYGATSLALESLGVPLSKTEVYETVQAVAARVPGLKREQVFGGIKTKALRADLIDSRQPEQGAELEQIYQRYLPAAAPRKGTTATLAYRLRLLFLDRWNLWSRLTRYRRWRGPRQKQLDGTNNACERAIGWWIKERYRSMRGYKVPATALRVSRLLAWCGNFLNGAGADLATLLQ